VAISPGRSIKPAGFLQKNGPNLATLSASSIVSKYLGSPYNDLMVVSIVVIIFASIFEIALKLVNPKDYIRNIKWGEKERPHLLSVANISSLISIFLLILF
jgi:hypothetical protein